MEEDVEGLTAVAKGEKGEEISFRLGLGLGLDNDNI